MPGIPDRVEELERQVQRIKKKLVDHGKRIRRLEKGAFDPKK
jgi:hypothetical protein